MATIEEAISSFLAEAEKFEHRLQVLLDHSHEIQFRIEKKKRFFKVTYWRKGWESGTYACIDRDGNIDHFLYGRYGILARDANVLTNKFGFPELPEAGSDQSEIWAAWFQTFEEFPFKLTDELSKLTQKADIATVIDAIRITGAKRATINVDANRVRYIYGILRQKALESASPDIASEMRTIHTLAQYWKNQPRGSGYLDRYLLKQWLRFCTPDEIRAVMNSAGGLWRDLKDEMEQVVASRTASNVAK